MSPPMNNGNKGPTQAPSASLTGMAVFPPAMPSAFLSWPSTEEQARLDRMSSKERTLYILNEALAILEEDDLSDLFDKDSSQQGPHRQ